MQGVLSPAAGLRQCPPAICTSQKFLHSSEHSAKAFADNLTVFSSSPEDHQSLLSTINEKCSDLDLTLKPEKCISIVFNGSKMNHTTSFSLSNCSTRNGHVDFGVKWQILPLCLKGKFYANHAFLHKGKILRQGCCCVHNDSILRH